VIDVSRLGHGRLPERPAEAVGVLLDRVSREELPRVQTALEALWGVPVLGALPELPVERAMLRRVNGGSISANCLCDVLGSRLAETFCVERFERIAARTEFPCVTGWAFRAGRHFCGLTVAVAYDEAFQGYFPDVLDVLELQGAQVKDFSPLRDEALPAGTDIVYLGWGQPQRYARQLAANQCLALALRNHACHGRRIYAEGGGLAFLCQQLRTPDRETFPMAGVLPAVAQYTGNEASPPPAEIQLSTDHWLAPRGAILRGYRGACWEFTSLGPVTSFAASPAQRWDLWGHQEVIGSRLHLNFAAQPAVLRRIFAAEKELTSAAASR
jgi:cobyrinic acid a,c-diamide synthase